MAATTAPAPRFRYIGITDESTTCDNCGKVELKATVVIMPLDEGGADEGDVVYYGSTCAARALSVRGGGAKVRKDAGNATRRLKAQAVAARAALARDGEGGDPAVRADRLRIIREAELIGA